MLTWDVLNNSAAIYETESQRRKGVQQSIQDLLGKPANQTELPDGSSNDSVTLFAHRSKQALLAIWEYKAEIGFGGKDPTIQAGFGYSKWWASAEAAFFRNRSCCASFLLSIAGAWLFVSGAVLVNNHWVVEPITSEYNGTISNDPRHVERVARLIIRLREAIEVLEEEYRTIAKQGAVEEAQSFPDITSYTIDGTTTTFVYEKVFNYDSSRTTRTLLQARMSNGQLVMVKFVRTYNGDAHRLLANEGLAPQLYYCGSYDEHIPDQMAVMELIEGHDMYHKAFTEKQLQDVRRAKDLLHENGYVFGDLRSNNILRTKAGEIKLIDFDWCGKDGQELYPVDMNPDVKCGCHPDAKGGRIMKKCHDDYLVDKFPVEAEDQGAFTDDQ